jgi:hypothetical protein
MPVLKVEPGYRHLVQKRNLCASACIQMVLFRRGIWTDQERLAFELGTRIEEKDKWLYTLPFRALPSKSPDIGINIADFRKKKVTGALGKHGLEFDVFLTSEIESLESFLADNINKGNDVMINFWWKPISGIDFGHFVLLSEYDTEKRTLTVCDPSPGRKSLSRIGLEKLVKAMGPEFTGKERGLVVFRGKKAGPVS